jgi:hypothetical protein
MLQIIMAAGNWTHSLAQNLNGSMDGFFSFVTNSAL